MAGLDSIAQAAGRCNRNGRLAVGRMVVFDPTDASAERFLADTANCAGQIMHLYEDPLSLEAIEHYFRLYYWDQSSRWDSKLIMEEFRLNQDPDLPFLFGFASVADRFRLIEETVKSVIIPWGAEGERYCEELRRSWEGPSARLLRKLQRFTVQVRHRDWDEHGDKAFELVHDQYPVLSFPEAHYSHEYGLTLGNDLSELLVT
jgi:CRISPR-associated endonuclease/helicase Cas3